MKRKGLIMGGARFHGFLLAESLAQEDDLYVLNRGNYRKEYDSRINHLIADRNIPVQLEDALANLEFDYIIDNNAYNPNQIESFLKIMKDRVGHFIFTSSAAVYLSIDSEKCFKESEATGISNGFFPSNVKEYALNKLKSEKIVQSMNNNYTIIRLTNVFGEGDFVGKTFYFQERINDGGKILLEREAERFGAIYSKDIPRIFSAIILNKDCFGKTFNLADSVPCSIDGLLKNISQEYDSKKSIKITLEMMLKIGYTFPWGILVPPSDVSSLERTIGKLNFTPLKIWVPKSLEWEAKNLDEKRKAEYRSARENELIIIKEIENGSI